MNSLDLSIFITTFLCVMIFFSYFWVKLYRKKKLFARFLKVSLKPKEQKETLVQKIQRKFRILNRVSELILVLRLKITIAQFLVASIIGYVIATAFVSYIISYIFVAIFMGLFGACMPYFYLLNREYKRKKEINSQFAPMIRHLSNYLKAGNNFRQSIEKTALVTEGELGVSIEHIVKRINGGEPIHKAIEVTEKYIPIVEFKMFHILVSIHNDMGGDLAESLNNLADVIDKKKVLKDEIDNLTQETKVSAYITAVIPTLIFFALKLTSPDYLKQIEKLPFGNILLVASFFFIVLGVVVVKKMSAVKVDKSYK